MADNVKSYYKERIVEKLSEIRDDVGEAHYLLYCDIVDDCDDIEMLKQMSEINLQIGYIKYVREQIQSKINKLGFSIKDLEEIMSGFGGKEEELEVEQLSSCNELMRLDEDDDERDLALMQELARRFMETDGCDGELIDGCRIGQEINIQLEEEEYNKKLAEALEAACGEESEYLDESDADESDNELTDDYMNSILEEVDASAEEIEEADIEDDDAEESEFGLDGLGGIAEDEFEFIGGDDMDESEDTESELDSDDTDDDNSSEEFEYTEEEFEQDEYDSEESEEDDGFGFDTDGLEEEILDVEEDAEEDTEGSYDELDIGSIEEDIAEGPEFDTEEDDGLGLDIEEETVEELGFEPEEVEVADDSTELDFSAQEIDFEEEIEEISEDIENAANDEFDFDEEYIEEYGGEDDTDDGGSATSLSDLKRNTVSSVTRNINNSEKPQKTGIFKDKAANRIFNSISKFVGGGQA